MILLRLMLGIFAAMVVLNLAAMLPTRPADPLPLVMLVEPRAGVRMVDLSSGATWSMPAPRRFVTTTERGRVLLFDEAGLLRSYTLRGHFLREEFLLPVLELRQQSPDGCQVLISSPSVTAVDFCRRALTPLGPGFGGNYWHADSDLVLHVGPGGGTVHQLAAGTQAQVSSVAFFEPLGRDVVADYAVFERGGAVYRLNLRTLAEERLFTQPDNETLALLDAGATTVYYFTNARDRLAATIWEYRGGPSAILNTPYVSTVFFADAGAERMAFQDGRDGIQTVYWYSAAAGLVPLLTGVALDVAIFERDGGYYLRQTRDDPNLTNVTLYAIDPATGDLTHVYDGIDETILSVGDRWLLTVDDASGAGTLVRRADGRRFGIGPAAAVRQVAFINFGATLAGWPLGVVALGAMVLLGAHRWPHRRVV